MKMHALPLAALVAALLAVPARAEEPPNPTDPTIANGQAERALDRARARWKTARIGSYDLEAQRTCFCPTTGFHTVKVRKGRLRGTPHAEISEIATVPRLFKAIQKAIDAKAHKLTVSYGTYGVPRKISIDRIANVVDEEQYFTIRRFKRR